MSEFLRWFALALSLVAFGNSIYLTVKQKRWRDKADERILKDPTPYPPTLYPMGAVTFAIACSHCKNVGGGEICRLCKQELASGFALKEKKPGQWLFHSARRTNLFFECSECGAVTKG